MFWFCGILIGLGIEAVAVETPFAFPFPEFKRGKRDNEFRGIVIVIHLGFPFPFHIPGNGKASEVQASTGNQAFPPYTVGVGSKKEGIIAVVKGIE